jgi:uncharacterized alkaline shock family protein YloU
MKSAVLMLFPPILTGAIDKLDEIPISTRLIKQIHQTLLSSGRGVEKMPGEFRTSQNHYQSQNHGQ